MFYKLLGFEDNRVDFQFFIYLLGLFIGFIIIANIEVGHRSKSCNALPTEVPRCAYQYNTGRRPGPIPGVVHSAWKRSFDLLFCRTTLYNKW